MGRKITLAVLAATSLQAFIIAAKADSVADFYKGKTFTILVGHTTGGGYDFYARTLARHIGRHIPGQPQVAVQNMPGAGGLRALNWLTNAGPQDGTMIGTMTFSAPFDPLLGRGKGKFDPRKLVWIGNMNSSVSVCGATRASGIKTFADLQTKPLVVGGSSQTGPLTSVPRALKNLLGAKIRVVLGYTGSTSVKLAITRGEVQGSCGASLSSVHVNFADLRQTGNFNIFLHTGEKPEPQLPGVPGVYSFAKTPDDRKLFDLVFGVQRLGRPYMARAETPPDRAKALQAAFEQTMKDPALLAEAKKTKTDIEPVFASELSAFIKNVFETPKPLVERARKAIRE